MLSSEQQRRPLPFLLYKSLVYGSLCHFLATWLHEILPWLIKIVDAWYWTCMNIISMLYTVSKILKRSYDFCLPFNVHLIKFTEYLKGQHNEKNQMLFVNPELLKFYLYDRHTLLFIHRVILWWTGLISRQTHDICCSRTIKNNLKQDGGPYLLQLYIDKNVWFSIYTVC